MIYYFSVGVIVGLYLFIRKVPRIFSSQAYYFMMISVFQNWGRVPGILWGYFCILLALLIYLVLGAISWPYILWRMYVTKRTVS